MDTSPLQSLGTFYLEFQLTDGSALNGDANSQAMVTNFDLTGGTLGDVLSPTIGNVIGSLGSSLTLTDGPVAAGPVADYAQAFAVTSSTGQLHFDVQFTVLGVDSPTFDSFSFLLLDSTLNSLPTNGPTGAEFVSADFTSLSPIAAGFASSDNTGLTAVVTSVPEPSALAALASGFSLLLLIKCQRRWANDV